MEENLHKGHRERVKNKFVEFGLDVFTDHEVLELLLFYAIPMKDTNKLAHQILREYGSLHNLFEASPIDIARKCKVSNNTATLISLISQVCRKYFASKWSDKKFIDSSKSMGEYCISLFAGRSTECIYLICLNSQMKINHSELLRTGTISESEIYPREIVESAIKHQATNVILAHNHPGGGAEPSGSDIEATNILRNGLRFIGVELIDHFVVAGDKFYSFSENGLL